MMNFPTDAVVIVNLIVPPCIMLLISIALWLFVRSEMRRSVPMRIYATVVTLVGILLASALMVQLFGHLDWLSVVYQFANCLFMVSSFCLMVRLWKPAAPAASIAKPALRETMRVRQRKVRIYKNPKGRKPNRGRTAFSRGSTFKMNI